MLRLIVLLLALLNGAYFLWSSGWLRAYGLAPVQQAEPQRLDQQIRPESVRVMSPQEFKQVETQAQETSGPSQ
jgi:hypothetical protein